MEFNYQKFSDELHLRLDEVQEMEFKEYFKGKQKKLRDYVVVSYLPLDKLAWTNFTKESCALPEEITIRLSGIVSLFFPNKYGEHPARRM